MVRDLVTILDRQLPARGRFVLAVSGGIDSMVLLDAANKLTGREFIVAHFDHGLRDNSADDAAFVEQAAIRYEKTFAMERANLGKRAGEAQARAARYQFLTGIKDRFQADAIVTAHQQDDVFETMMINLLRGSGWRGLCSLRSGTDHTLRPLLSVPRRDIAFYADRHELTWREDSTNHDTKYLRNYIRHELLPKLLRHNKQLKAQLYELYTEQCRLRDEIEPLLNGLLEAVADGREGQWHLNRQLLAQLPPEIATELLRELINRLPGRHELNRPKLERLIIFTQTAQPGKRFEISGDITVISERFKIRLWAAKI